jgi:hypothetical protein
MNVEDLPTQPHPETHAELLALAHAGRWPDFFELLGGSPVPDDPEIEAEAYSRATHFWNQMREDLGLPTGRLD